jgi:hypothetical protein
MMGHSTSSTPPAAAAAAATTPAPAHTAEGDRCACLTPPAAEGDRCGVCSPSTPAQSGQICVDKHTHTHTPSPPPSLRVPDLWLSRDQRHFAQRAGERISHGAISTCAGVIPAQASWNQRNYQITAAAAAAVATVGADGLCCASALAAALPSQQHSRIPIGGAAMMSIACSGNHGSGGAEDLCGVPTSWRPSATAKQQACLATAS